MYTPQLIALFSAIFYASVAVSARLGLQYSTPLTATCVALSVRTVTLWAAVFLTGGIPRVAFIAVLLFVILGVVQTATSLLTYIGISKIGASRSQPLRNTYPLWSAMIAITVLGEEAGFAVLVGTLFVVVGIVLISWQPEEKASVYRWWHVVFPLGGAFLAGIAFPVRRYALTISNEPLLFSALLAVVSLTCLVMVLLSPVGTQRPVWNRKALLPFIVAGGFESLAAFLSLVAVSVGRVVVVSPIVATSPFWTLLMTVVFLRGLERINARTVIGTFCVVAGTIAIIVWG
ncbi:MAG: EamA family transporter [Candidatus Methylomirabilales bacterium]